MSNSRSNNLPNNLWWSSWHDRLHQTLRHRQLLAKGQRVLVAVSGGQDSLCLIHLLLDLQSRWGWELAIAHCDHRWREDSGENAAYVAELAQQWQVPCHLLTATEPPTSEAAAREWRYRVLTELASAEGYSTIATGHTASDRAETLLYNLLRGSGMDGLQALAWRRPLASEVELIRPLLEFTRQDTGTFCQEYGLRVWQDETNSDVSYARNRIRQELLPYLQQTFNPQLETLLAQTSELLQADVDYLEIQAAEWLAKATNFSVSTPGQMPGAMTPEMPNYGYLHRQVLRTAPLAIQRRVMRQFLQQQLGIHPSFAQVEKITTLITAPNRSQTDPFPSAKSAHTSARIIARVEGVWILLISLD